MIRMSELLYTNNNKGVGLIGWVGVVTMSSIYQSDYQVQIDSHLRDCPQPTAFYDQLKYHLVMGKSYQNQSKILKHVC